MNFWLIVRLLFTPVLLPLTLVYGLISFFIRLLPRKKIKSKFPVISVGNILTGGTGKTPLVELICEAIIKEKKFPVVVSRSYKVEFSEKIAQEVILSRKAKVFGDEPYQIKSKFLGRIKVFVGTSKWRIVKTIESEIPANSIIVVDDGHQHHKLKKDLKLVVWDASRPLIDNLPFPWGMSREFCFLSPKPDLTIFNRSDMASDFKINWLKKTAAVGKQTLFTSYKVNSILGLDGLKKLPSKNGHDLVLISGIGNFEQLQNSVEQFLDNKNLRLSNIIKGADHDSFKWFKPDSEKYYICTEKDQTKLKEKITEDKLLVVKSSFDNNLKENLSKTIRQWIRNMGQTND